ncbi:hypothetical protein SEEE0316_00799, partial [Salmonella enterica subsp. enterica serovar Enteritidis str. 648903 1-6]
MLLILALRCFACMEKLSGKEVEVSAEVLKRTFFNITRKRKKEAFAGVKHLMPARHF